MSDRIFPITVRQLLAAADKHNVTIPPKLRNQIDKDIHIIDLVSEMNFKDGPTIAEALVDALAGDRDPFSDPAVQAAMTRETIANRHSFGGLTEAARVRLLETVTASVEDIVESFKPAFNKAGAKLATAHATLTSAGVPTPDAPEVMNRSLPIAAASIDARNTLETIREIWSVIDLVLNATGRSSGAAGGRTAQIIDTGDATSGEVRQLEQGRKADPWAALNAGYTISLATPTEVKERVARVRAADQQTEADAVSAFKDAFKSIR